MDADPPLRIAIVAPPYYQLPPKSYGGVERICWSLAEELVRRGHAVTLIGAGESTTSALFVSTFSQPQPEGTPRELTTELIHAARAQRALSDLDVDITHDHTRAGLLTASSRSAPTLMTVHAPLAGPESLYELYDAFGPHLPLVALSESQRNAAPALWWAGVVPNGVDISDFPFSSDKEDFVLYLGRMSAHKGVHVAIDAARESGRRLVIAGTWTIPSEQQYFESEVRPRLDRDVEWVGAVSGRERTALLSRAACLLFPVSWEEPFGLVMLEAMASGTPVVALRAGAIPEVVADGLTGIVCDDPAQLPEAIDRATKLDHAASRAHVAKYFSVQTMTERYERVYRRQLDRS